MTRTRSRRVLLCGLKFLQGYKPPDIRVKRPCKSRAPLSETPAVLQVHEVLMNTLTNPCLMVVGITLILIFSRALAQKLVEDQSSRARISSRV